MQTNEINKKPNPFHFMDTVIPINTAAINKFKGLASFFRNFSKK